MGGFSYLVVCYGEAGASSHEVGAAPSACDEDEEAAGGSGWVGGWVRRYSIDGWVGRSIRE